MTGAPSVGPLSLPFVLLNHPHDPSSSVIAANCMFHLGFVVPEKIEIVGSERGRGREMEGKGREHMKSVSSQRHQ